MARPRIIEPPAAAIDWNRFQYLVRETWPSPKVFRESMGLRSQATVMNAWNGKSIGLLPYLRICRKMGANPFACLIER